MARTARAFRKGVALRTPISTGGKHNSRTQRKSCGKEIKTRGGGVLKKKNQDWRENDQIPGAKCLGRLLKDRRQRARETRSWMNGEEGAQQEAAETQRRVRYSAIPPRGDRVIPRCEGNHALKRDVEPKRGTIKPGSKKRWLRPTDA